MNEAEERRRLTEDLPLGGQAVIEGVMMRAPGRIVTAVRVEKDRILVREEAYMPLVRRFRRLDLPLLRGAVSFFEMLVIGMKALNFSADAAMQAGEEEKVVPLQRPDSGTWRRRLTLAGTLIVALGLGIGFFFFLPLAAAELLGVPRDALRFNLIAGLVRAGLLLLYMWGIGRWGEIQRVFQYHGAEHKSIFAAEASVELTVENARRFGRLHPRCGTSFLLIVVLVAVVVFALFDSLFVLSFGHPQNLVERFATHLCVLPLIGGIGFELLKLSGRKRNHPLTRLLIAPGLWLQRITTREPDDAQLEVALVALRCALGEEIGESTAASRISRTGTQLAQDSGGGRSRSCRLDR